MTNSDIDHSKVITFLADYASWMLGCGATCVRIEKNVRRIATKFDIDVDIMLMPAHVEISLQSNDGHSAICVRKIQPCGISFNLNTALSRLSWDIADGKYGFKPAVEKFGEIIKTPPTNKWEVLLLASCANAAFCRLFGGDFQAMMIVFFSTLAGYRIKQVMLGAKCDIRLTVLCASFFSAAISAGGHVFGISNTPEIALGSSVLYLIPGVPYINAVSDIIDRHYLCAISRLTDAFILTTCLSLGLCMGMIILGLHWF